MIDRIPASFIRFVGRLQFHVPWLRGVINRAAQLVISALDDRIQRGSGKGLRFDARGTYPGYLLGTSEPLEQATLARLLHPGGVLYDIGANAGFYVILGARLAGESGYVYAIEPTPALAEKIRRNVRLNSFGNVEVIEAAVSNFSGTVAFQIDGDLGVQNSIAEEPNGRNLIEVQCTTVDAIAADRRPPSLVMIDIEGAEIDALRGALETIRQHRPYIMVEVHWLGSQFTEFVRDHLLPLGYVATTYDGSPLPTGNERYHCILSPSGNAPASSE
jgi:FkbM family methyltransferase